MKPNHIQTLLSNFVLILTTVKDFSVIGLCRLEKGENLHS